MQDWPVTQIRFARPTHQLDAVVRFYRDGLGLRVLGSFAGHAGYSGVMLGLPGGEVHLELTQHDAGNPCPAPAPDNLLVLYVPDAAARAAMVGRMIAAGHAPVPPQNPYWLERGTTFEDPDGWGVVLMGSRGFED